MRIRNTKGAALEAAIVNPLIYTALGSSYGYWKSIEDTMEIDPSKAPREDILYDCGKVVSSRLEGQGVRPCKSW